MANKFLLVLVSIALVISFSACRSSLPEPQATPPTPSPAASPTAPSPSPTWSTNPYALISLDSLLAYLGDLTSIQPFSGWRNSASSGEAEALDYVQGKLGEFSSLQGKGLELERQEFNVYLSTELWASSLALSLNGQTIEVPAQGLRASRFDRRLAAYFDSDGVLNDSHSDPMTASGAPLVVRDAETFNNLTANEINGRVLFLDFSLMDRFVNSDLASNASRLLEVVDKGLAGMVLVTRFSNQARESHGTVLADGTIFPYEIPVKRIPVLFVRLEDLGPAGIGSWEDLERVTSASLTLDADVFSPGKSGNLIARIPGADGSRAIILGAHIDSPNGPGAFDDGSGSAALLEIARVLDATRITPPTDITLAWFGGHEIGTYGSAYFAATHQELLDRTMAAIIMDCLGHPLESHDASITMALTSYGRFGSESLPLADYVSASAAGQGISVDRVIEDGLIADNSNFDAFNVPELDLLYMNGTEFQSKGADYAHYANHWHDPYESVEQVKEVAAAYVDMTRVLLSAVLEADTVTTLRVAHAPSRRAVFIGSHTETTTVITALLRELGMALAWEGFDVDLVPYGQTLTPSDLENADILVLPPTLDYPGANKETWTEGELALLHDYVREGGFLVVTNSGFNFSTKRPLDDHNEDSRALNAFLEPMGIQFGYGLTSAGRTALAVSNHPLMQDASYLEMFSNNSIPFTMKTGTVLAESAGNPIVGLVDFGDQDGQVLVLADVGILQADSAGARNLEFLKNIARYASTR